MYRKESRALWAKDQGEQRHGVPKCGVGIQKHEPRLPIGAE